MSIVITDDSHYKGIADKIRETTESEDAIFPSEMAKKITDVYDAGKVNGIREMWETIQCGGERTNYSNLLGYISWTPENFKPIYDITQSTSWYNFGYNWATGYRELITEKGRISIKKLEEEQGISFILGRGDGNHTRLCTSPLFSEYNIVDISQSTTLAYTFFGGYAGVVPKRIEHLICSETTPFATTSFQLAATYEYIGFEGVIGKSLNLSWSPLVPESMKKAILCLKNYAGTSSEFVNTIKFNDECWAALEADSKAPDGNNWKGYVATLGWLT